MGTHALLSLVNEKAPSVIALLAAGILAVVAIPGCSKTNDIDAGPSGGASTCNGEACDGTCVEGVCRGYCDHDYHCPGEDTCTAIEDVAVCIPPGARVYEPYQALDMLEECAANGCEIPLNAPSLEGVLRGCDSTSPYTAADMANPDFDYEAACATRDDYNYQLVQGRRIYDLWGNGADKSCAWSHLGAGPSDSLIRYSCDYDYTDTLVTSAEFARVVERGAVTYVWTGGPRPSSSAGEVYPRLSVLAEGDRLEIPSACDFGMQSAEPALPRDCELPTYPALGRAVGPEFEGLWVGCDTPNADAPEQCELNFGGPTPEGYPRSAFYIDERGYGQAFSFEGGVTQARPTKCNAAFRLTREQTADPNFASDERMRGYIIGSEIPFGSVSLEASVFEEVIEISDGPGTAPGTYIVGNGRSTYWLKRVPLPEDFVDPCAGTQPPLTW
jgi:hypothetical protein